MPLVGITGPFPCKKHRKVPVKLPLWLNLPGYQYQFKPCQLSSRVVDPSAINGTQDPKP